MEPGNVLHISSLSPGWCDKNSVMLHACFQLLRDCIEDEKLFERDINWDYDDRHRSAKAELLELNQWWKSRSRMDEMDASLGDQEAKDDAMLARLIGNRWALWV